MLFLLISFPKKKINEYRKWGGVKEKGRGKETYLKSVLLLFLPSENREVLVRAYTI